MGLGITVGSWTEPRDALVSTLVGALVFWLLGAAVGLCVSSDAVTPRTKGLRVKKSQSQSAGTV